MGLVNAAVVGEHIHLIVPVLSHIARLRIFLVMGAFLYHLSMDMREGKAVFIWMSLNSSSEQIFLGE